MWIVPVVLALLGIAAAWALPRIVARIGAAEIDRLSKRLAGTVDHGEVRLVGTSRVEVERISWREGQDFEALVEGVGIDVDPLAAVLGGRPVQRVEARRVTVKLGDPGKPLRSPGEVLARLKRLLAPREASGGRAGKRDRPLPDLAVGDLRGTFALMGRSAVFLGGRLTLGVPAGEMDPLARHLDLRLEGALDDGVSRTVRIEGRLTGTRPEEARLSLSPALVIAEGGHEVAAAGVAWRNGELSVLGPRLARAAGGTLEADSITVRWEAGGDEGEAPGDGIRSAALPEGLPAPVRDFLARHPLREIEVSRPVLDVTLPRAVPAAAQAVADAVAPAESPTEGMFKRSVTRAFQALADRLERGTGAWTTAATRFPAARLVVHGATVRYDGEDPATAGLANLDAMIRREHADGPIEGRISFETPETRDGTNEARFTADPATARVEAVVTARRLPIGPYRGLLPPWLVSGDTTAIRDTELAITIQGGDARTLTVQGKMAAGGVGVDLPALASVPLKDLDAGVGGTVVLDWGKGTLEWREGVATLRALKAPFEVQATGLADVPRVKVQASLERVRAQELVESIPPEAVPALEGVELSGSFAATLRLDVDAGNLGAMVFDFQPDVADLTTVALGRGVNLELLRHEFLHRIEEGGGQVVDRRVGETSPGWVPLTDVPQHFVDALTTGEDSSFFSHHGFSVVGIRRSLQVNLDRGGFYQGASTLSQQLVKNLFLSREKTLARKLQEVFITWQLERFLSKEKILELYLNVIEWGPEVWGLGEAAMHYFGKKPSELALLESAYLVSIIPSPRRFHEHYLQGSVPKPFESRVKGLVREMRRRNLVGEDPAEEALEAHVRFAQAPASEGLPPPDEEFGE